MRIRLWVLCVLLGATLLGTVARAEDSAIQALQDFVQRVQSASGQFNQHMIETAAQTDTFRARQSGQFAFQRPGRFRWETTTPHAQIITSDGVIVSQYDPDLAQITQRPAGRSLGYSPAAILFGSDALEDVFQLTPLPDHDGLQWLRATPRQSDAGFQYMDMGFANHLPARLLLADAFDQMTQINLHDMTLNPALADDLFVQAAPPDVDVVRLQ